MLHKCDDSLLKPVIYPQHCSNGFYKESYQRNHVDHGGITGNKEQKGNLNCARLLNVTKLKLLNNKTTEQVILGLL